MYKIVAVILLLLPLLVNALGLGNARIHSKLNEPLNIELELLVNNPKDLQSILPTIASPQDFEQAGLDRPYFLNSAHFKLETQSGKSIVRLTTKEAVKEPVVNLLVELNSAEGRILKEYTVLLDPPETLQLQQHRSQALVEKPRQNNLNKQNDQDNSAIFDAFAPQMPTVSVKPAIHPEEEAKQQAQNQVLQSRLTKIEQQLHSLAQEKAQVEEAKLVLKEENDNLHDLVQARQQEIDNLKEQQIAQNPPGASSPPQKRSELSHFAKTQILAPADEQHNPNASSSTPWLILGLILTFLMSAIIGLRELFKRKEISMPFEVSLPAFPFGLKENKTRKDAEIQSPLSKKQTNNQQAFEGAISSIQAAEEKQNINPDTNIHAQTKQPVPVKIVLPTLEDAEIYITFSKYKMAEEIILKILNHDPNHIQARLKLIDLMFAQEKLAEAETHFNLLPENFSKDYAKEYRDYKSRINILKAAASPDDISPEFEQELEANEPENNLNAPTSASASLHEPAINHSDNHLLEPPQALSQGFTPTTPTEESENACVKPAILEQDPSIFQTKLDFAKVYIDMKDMESARDLLNEVLNSGIDQFKEEAEALMEKTK